MGQSQGFCLTSCNARDSPLRQREIQPKTSLVLSLRSPIVGDGPSHGAPQNPTADTHETVKGARNKFLWVKTLRFEDSLFQQVATLPGNTEFFYPELRSLDDVVVCCVDAPMQALLEWSISFRDFEICLALLWEERLQLEAVNTCHSLMHFCCSASVLTPG